MFRAGQYIDQQKKDINNFYILKFLTEIIFLIFIHLRKKNAFIHVCLPLPHRYRRRVFLRPPTYPPIYRTCDAKKLGFTKGARK